MNKAVIVVIAVVILESLVESRPRYRHRHRHRSWHKYLSSSEESSESENGKSCTNCTITNIGNGYKNHNIIYYSSEPKSKTENKETYWSWRKFVKNSQENSESDSLEFCNGCTITNYGNGERTVNVIRHNSYPNSKINQGQTEMYHPVQEQGQIIVNGHRVTPKETYNTPGGNEMQSGDRRYNTQRPLRPNENPINGNKPNNDFYPNYNGKKKGEIGNFGNGHDNTNTFNIHKKDIYIS